MSCLTYYSPTETYLYMDLMCVGNRVSRQRYIIMIYHHSNLLGAQFIIDSNISSKTRFCIRFTSVFLIYINVELD